MEVDYIVVGAGTAGSVLAERLSASGQHRVAVVEAGRQTPGAFSAMPAGFPRIFKSGRDWNLATVPQRAAGERVVYVPRGRMLGGSAAMNAQIHQWGHPADFDGWVDSGARGWGWSDVAPLFARQERFSDEGAARGQGGPMAVEVNRHAHHAARDFVTAARSMPGAGPCSPDYNGGAYEGAWLSQIAHAHGRRFSAYDAYLRPAQRRPNVAVVRGAMVSRVLLSEGVARGVVLKDRQGERQIRARGGVILAAGAFGSPEILMRSGVGCAGHLSGLGVPVVIDRPAVGANLHDHPMAILSFPTRHADTYRSADSVAALLRYLFLRRGPLASNVAEAIAFAKSHPSLRAPDLELIFAPVEWRNQALEPARVHAFTIGAAVVAPKSRGVLRLQGSGMSPRIDFNLLGDPDAEDRRACWRLFVGRAQWPRRRRSPVICGRLPWPPRSMSSRRRARACKPSTTRREPAAWARTETPWWIPAFRSAAYTDFGSPTRQ